MDGRSKEYELASARLKEVWRTIAEVPRYQVSNLGRVRNGNYRLYKTRECKTIYRTKKGYCYVGLKVTRQRGVSRFVARLVAEAFIGKRPLGMEVNHKDGNKENNRWDNLEYVTSSENKIHARKLGLAKRRFSVNTVRRIRQQYEVGYSQRVLARRYEVTHHMIQAIVTGKVYKDVA